MEEINLDNIMSNNKIVIISHISELLKEIISNYLNNKLEQKYSYTLFEIKNSIFQKIISLYEELYYLNNNNDKNYKMKNEIIDDIMDFNKKKIITKNKIYSFHIFEILDGNKYNKLNLTNHNIFTLFNYTIILLQEICNIIYIHLKEFDNKFEQESITEKYNLLKKYSSFFQKIFYYLISIYIKRQEENDTENGQNIINDILKVYNEKIPFDLYVELFKNLVPTIIDLFPKLNKESKNILLMNLFSFEKKEKIKAKKNILTKYFFEYYSDKIYEIGNNDNNIDSLLIIKSLYKYLFEEINNDFLESQIIPIFIDYFLISKKSNNPINYIYIIGHIISYFKIYNMRNINAVSNQIYNEIKDLIHPMINYLFNFGKEQKIFRLYISEIIITMPSKLICNLEYFEIIISSIIIVLKEKRIDLLELCISHLDNLLDLLIKSPNKQINWIEKKSFELINLLINLLDKEKKSSKYLLFILRIASKLSIIGFSHNVSKISFKKYPELRNKIKVNLIDKNQYNNISINYMLGYVIDFFYQSTKIHKYKNYNSQFIKENIMKNDVKNLKLIDEINLYLKFYRKCILFYFQKYNINYSDILELKKNIINNINNKQIENLLNDNNKSKEINDIYLNSEKSFFKKIFQGYFYNFSLLNSIFFGEKNNLDFTKDIKGIKFDNNININKFYNLYKEEYPFFDFICNNFILMILYKKYYHENGALFSFDPFIIIDCIFSFLKFVNNDLNCSQEFSIAMIDKIIDNYLNFFDNDAHIINNLEMTNVLYLKIFNFLNNNKIGPIVRISLLEILISKFNKYNNRKYLYHFFKCITFISYSYQESNNINNIEEKFTKLIDIIIKQFINNDINYYNINNNDLEKLDINNEATSEKETLYNFYLLYDFLRICFDEMNNNLISSNNNTRKIAKYIINKIIIYIPQLKKIQSVLFQLDYDKINLKQFLDIFKTTKISMNPSNIILNINNNKTGLTTLSNYINKKSGNESLEEKYIMPFFQETKLFLIIKEKLKCLKTRINLNENNFSPFICNLDSLIDYFEYCPELIIEYIFNCNKDNNNNILLFIEIIKSCYYNILLDNYMINEFKSYKDDSTKNIYILLEKFLENKNANFPFKVIVNNQSELLKIDEEIPNNYLEIIENDLYKSSLSQNINNIRDKEMYEVYDFVKLKVIMISKYIKILNYFINNKLINLFLNYIPDDLLLDYKRHKIKIIKLIIYTIVNRQPKILIKEAASLLTQSLINDKQLINYIIINDFYYQQKLSNIIIEFNNENIDKSNCSVNLDASKGIQLKNLDFLLILSKLKLLDNNYINTILDKLHLFENKLQTKKINNSILLLYYRYLSLIYYINVNYDINIDKEIQIIYSQLIEINKIFILQPLNQCIFFNKTKDFNRIIKFIMKNKKKFITFIIYKNENNKEWTYIFNFIKRIIKYKKLSLVFEAAIKGIIEILRNEIFDNNDMNNNIIDEKNVNKLLYLLKIIKIIGFNYPLYLQSCSLIEISDKFLSKNKNILIKNQNLCKCWINIFIIYLKNYKNITHLFSFINYYNIENLQESIIRKVDLFLSNEFLNSINSNIIKKIFNKYCKLKKDEEIELITNKLIIPLLIKYTNNVFLLSNDTNSEYNQNTLINFNGKILQKILTVQEIKTDAIYKLLTLIIVTYKILIKDKNLNASNEQIRNVIKNIQVIINKLETKKSKVFIEYLYVCKNLSDSLSTSSHLNNEIIDYSNKFKFENEDSKSVINELILFYCYNNQIILNLIKSFINENKTSKFKFLKIFVDNPSLISKFCEKSDKKIFINELLNCMNKEIKVFNELSYQEKAIIITLIGLIVAQKKNLISQTFFLLSTILLELIQIIICDNQENNIKDNIDFLELLLFYYREMIKLNTYFIFKLNIDLKEIKFDYGYFYYLYFLKINILNIPLEQIYSNIKEYISLYQTIIEKNISNKILLFEYCFILRILSQKDLPERLNNLNNCDCTIFLNYRIYMYLAGNKLIEELDLNKDNITNYEINEPLLQNTFYIDVNKILNNFVFPYLIKNNLYNNKNQFNIFSNNIKNIDNYNSYNYSWLKTFPMNDFCIFIFYYKFFEEFYNDKRFKEFKYAYDNYSFDIDILKEFGYMNNNNQIINKHNIISNVININNNLTINTDKSFETGSSLNNVNTKNNTNDSYILNNNEKKINNLKNILTLGEKKKSFFSIINTNFLNLKKRINSLLKKYFENFVYFTLFFLNEYKNILNIINKNDKEFSINNNKEYIDYFILSNISFYFNLKEFTYIRNSNSEKIKYFDFNTNNIKKKIFLYYPDIILTGLNFFFKCDEISEKYYKTLSFLFILVYRHFKDKNIYDNNLEHLLNNIILRNNYLLNDINLEHEFIYNILTAREISSNEIKIAPNILNLFINHFQKRTKENSLYSNNLNFISLFYLMLCYSIQKNLPQKSILFEAYNKKRFSNKENIVDVLKQFFSYTELYEYSNEFIDFIPIWTYVILSYFKENTNQIGDENENIFCKFDKMEFNYKSSVDILESDDINREMSENKISLKYDKDEFIKKMVNNCNLYLDDESNKKYLLELVKNVIFYKKNYSKINQVFTSLFVHLWSTIKMKDREDLKIIINEFLDKYTRKVKNKNSYFLNILINTFSQCKPLIIIKPEIISSLIYYTNNSLTLIFYLENLINSGVEIPNSYHSLLYIFDCIKEPHLSYGLKKLFLANNYSKSGINNLQINNYSEAEKVFYDCFDELNHKLENIKLEEYDDNQNNFGESYLKNIDNSLFKDLSTWESGLIECYKEKNEINNITKIEECKNSEELKDYCSWNKEGETLEDIILNLQTVHLNLNDKKYNYEIIINKKFYYIQKIQFYILNNIKYENYSKNKNDFINLNNTLLSFIHDYFKLPRNCDNLIDYYFSLFQIIANEYEQINLFQTLKVKSKSNNNAENEKIKSLYKDYFFMLKQTAPKLYGKFNLFKKVINQRNNFFGLIGEKEIKSNIINKIYNQADLLKFTRNLKLYENFHESLQNFQNNNQNLNELINANPCELYFVIEEYLKYIKKCSYNYDFGINLCDEYLNKFNKLKDNSSDLSLIQYIENNLHRYKAYFYYKNGEIMKAHKLFLDILDNNKGVEINDYHIYYDWGLLCENISIIIKDESEVDEWFENTIVNYLNCIIYGIRKSKFIIPLLFNFIKDFKNIKFKRKLNFEEEINETPSWIWLFWISIIYENYLLFENNKDINNFYFDILKRIANNHGQILYYWNNIYYNIYEENNSEIRAIKIDNIKQNIKLLSKIIKSNDRLYNNISKINTIINDIQKKLNEDNKNIEDISDDNNNNYYNQMNMKSFNFLDFSFLEFHPYYNNNIIISYDIEKLYTKKIQYQLKEKNKIKKHSLSIIASNDKNYKFIVNKGEYKTDYNIKLSKLKILFNHIFIKDIDTSKFKIEFIVPILFYLTNTIKIEQEEENIFGMENIYEYCLQKRGYPSDISKLVFNNERISNKNMIENLYEKMCEILPKNSFKKFIHKIIENCDDLFLFRKNMTNSLSINSFLNYLFSDKMYLKNMQVQKQTGSFIINNNINCFIINDINKFLNEEKNIIRLSKNISHFISYPGIYGIIPNIFFSSCKALVTREKKVINIIKIFFENKSEHYFLKLKNLINNKEVKIDKMEIEEVEEEQINKINENDLEGDGENSSMININRIIDNSLDDNVLRKEDPELKLWF